MKSCLDIPYYLGEDRCFNTGFLPMDSLPNAKICSIRWFHQKQTLTLLLRVVMGIIFSNSTACFIDDDAYILVELCED